jgi:hypothetical protein
MVTVMQAEFVATVGGSVTTKEGTGVGNSEYLILFEKGVEV